MRAPRHHARERGSTAAASGRSRRGHVLFLRRHTFARGAGPRLIMRLRYEEDFVESAVLLCATGRRKGASGMLIARFNRERDKLYEILDPDDRNAAFFRLHLDWFREWGLDA